jgi:hypothetical protein
MPYTSKQDTEAPFSHHISNAAGERVLEVRLPEWDAADDVAATNAREANKGYDEFAQRVALSLTFCEPAPVMMLAMGVRQGGIQPLAKAITAQGEEINALKAMVVGISNGIQESQTQKTAPETILAHVVSVIADTGFANDPKVKAVTAKADVAIGQILAGQEPGNGQPA